MIDWKKPLRMKNGRTSMLLPPYPSHDRRRFRIANKAGGDPEKEGTTYLYDEDGRCCGERDVPENLENYS